MPGLPQNLEPCFFCRLHEHAHERVIASLHRCEHPGQKRKGESVKREPGRVHPAHHARETDRFATLGLQARELGADLAEIKIVPRIRREALIGMGRKANNERRTALARQMLGDRCGKRSAASDQSYSPNRPSRRRTAHHSGRGLHKGLLLSAFTKRIMSITSALSA